MSQSYQTTIIAGIVALIFLMVTALIGLGATGRLDSTSTPLIMSVFGTATTVIVTLLNIVRTDRAVIEVKKTNGTVEDLTRRMEVSDPGGSREAEGPNGPVI